MSNSHDIFNSLTDSSPKTYVRLTISANDVSDLDVFSKSDPFCVVYEKIKGSKNGTKGKVTKETWRDDEWTERGRTEVVKNNLNPEFTTTIRIPYYFEENQLLRFELYDSDSTNVTNMKAHDFLGRFESVLAQIVSYNTLKAHLEKSSGLGRRWKNGDKKTKNGTLTIRAEEDEKNEKFQFEVRGENLDKKDFFGKSDPYLVFKRKFDDGNIQIVKKTEIKYKTLNPRWNKVIINKQTLCGNDLDFLFTIECYDYDKFKKDDLIGIGQASINQLINFDEAKIELINAKKKTKKGEEYKNSGVLKFWNCEIIHEPTFFDFLAGGTQLDFTVAIDFTASNGNVRDPKSLHNITNDRPNQYEIAIRACLSICQHYNSSKKFEAFGFGAKLSPNSKVSSMFELDLKNQTSTVVGIQGVMKAYRDCLNNVQLYGPTNFAPIIDKIGLKASRIAENSARYQILLIITDGIISDMHKTVESIINASFYPLSIIIIGVGNEDFEKMHDLDSDDKLLQQDGRIAQRDIVQFVTMRQFLNDGNGKYLDPEVVMENLAREVLYEVPTQLTSYMTKKGLKPSPPDDPWPRDSPMLGYDERCDDIDFLNKSMPINQYDRNRKEENLYPNVVGFENMSQASAPPIDISNVNPQF